MHLEDIDPAWILPYSKVAPSLPLCHTTHLLTHLDLIRLGRSRHAVFRRDQRRHALFLPALRDVPAVPNPLLAHDRVRRVHDGRGSAGQHVRVHAAVRRLGPQSGESVSVRDGFGILFLFQGEQYDDGYCAAGAADPGFGAPAAGVEG